MSGSLWRLSCLSLSPGLCSNSCLLSQWYYLTISSSAAPFSFCLQSFPASGSFPVSQLFTLCGQSIGASPSASVFPMNIQSGIPLGWTGLIFLLSRGLLQHHNLKTSILWHSALFMVQLSYLYITTGETIALTMWTFFDKVMSLLLNTLIRFVIAILPRSKHLLISWLKSPSTKKICHCFYFFPFCLPWSDGTRCLDLSFLNVEV